MNRALGIWTISWSVICIPEARFIRMTKRNLLRRHHLQMHRRRWLWRLLLKPNPHEQFWKTSKKQGKRSSRPPIAVRPGTANPLRKWRCFCDKQNSDVTCFLLKLFIQKSFSFSFFSQRTRIQRRTNFGIGSNSDFFLTRFRSESESNQNQVRSLEKKLTRPALVHNVENINWRWYNDSTVTN